MAFPLTFCLTCLPMLLLQNREQQGFELLQSLRNELALCTEENKRLQTFAQQAQELSSNLPASHEHVILTFIFASSPQTHWL